MFTITRSPTKVPFCRGLIWMICFTIVISHLSFYASALDISANSAIVIDAQNGKVVYSKNPNSPMPMASTTKIMTAIVAIEQTSKINTQVHISADAVGIEGSSIYLCEGEILTLEELLYALLLSSANDAATAIAIFVGGSIDGFVKLMNQKAQALGLISTSFQNPHGLDQDGHYTTAYDLAKLTQYALKNETFRRIVSTVKKSIPFCGKTNQRLLINHNRLLTSLEGTIGVKTGYTQKSGRCLVSAVKRDNTTLIAVTLSAPDDWNDHKLMYEYCFDSFETVLLKKFEIRIPVISGVKSQLLCGSHNESSVFINRTHGEIYSIVELYPFAYAPIKSGSKIGKIIYMCDGEIISEADIVALESVGKANQEYTVWDKLMDKIKKRRLNGVPK